MTSKKNIYNLQGNQLSRTSLRQFFFAFILIGLLISTTCWNLYSFFGQKGWVDQQNAVEFFNLMGHKRAWYENPFGGRFFSGVFQKRLDEAAADHFPLDLLLGYMKLERWVNGKLMSLLPIGWCPVLPAGGPILSLRSENRLINSPQTYLEHDEELLKQRAEYYNNLLQTHPDIRLLVFPVLPAEDLLATAPNFWRDSDKILAGKKWLERFRKFLDPRIMYSWGGEGLPLDKALHLYYTTDHHFTMKGAYLIYREIINHLQKDSTLGYTPRIPQEWYTVPDVQFRGGHARLAGKFNLFYDRLEDADFNLPQLSMVINKNDGSQEKPFKEEYLQGIFPRDEFADHYGYYYGDNYGMISYVCDEAPNRNILVISDSFDNPIIPLLSSHYRNSYFVDLRYYKDYMGGSSKFVKKNKINDIVFFGRQTRVLGFVGMDN